MDALVFGFISLPSKTQVFEIEEPLLGLSSFPSQTQLLGSSILFAISISFRLFNLLANSLSK